MISHSCEYKAEICNISFWSLCLRITLSVLFIKLTTTPFWCGCVEVEVKVASVGKYVGREEVDLPQALRRNCIYCCLWYLFFFFIHTNTALSWTLLPTCLSVDYNEFHYGVDSLQRCHYGFLAYCSGVQISGCALTGSSLVCWRHAEIFMASHRSASFWCRSRREMHGCLTLYLSADQGIPEIRRWCMRIYCMDMKIKP